MDDCTAIPFFHAFFVLFLYAIVKRPHIAMFFVAPWTIASCCDEVDGHYHMTKKK